MQRREFIKKTALAAGGLLAATPFASIMAKDNDSLEKQISTISR